MQVNDNYFILFRLILLIWSFLLEKFEVILAKFRKWNFWKALAFRENKKKSNC